MLPNFLVIGAMKAGTTSLASYLRAHPQMHLPERKELYFFTAEDNWTRGKEWYEAQFRGAGDALAVGEACVGYAMHPTYQGVPERIATMLPRVRLVYIVREPVDRMISHYRHRAWNGEEDLPIERALREHDVYLDTSRYAMQIDRYLEYFARESILIISSEELKTDRLRTLRRVFRFLGVAEEVEIANVYHEFHRTVGKRRVRPAADRLRSSRPYRAVSRAFPLRMRQVLYRLGHEWITDEPKISVALRRSLYEELRDDVEGLSRYMGDPTFDGWGILPAGALRTDRIKESREDN